MMTELEKFLKERTRVWASQITKLAKAFAPNHLRPYIVSRTELGNSGKFTIRTTVDRNANPKEKNGTLDARAQEYGSGLNARRGVKDYIEIRPKKFGGALAFYENAAGTWDYEMVDPPMPRSYAQDGRGLFFGRVLHPGIKAANNGQGYIGPAQNEVRKQIREELKSFGSAAIRADLRKAFGGRVK